MDQILPRKSATDRDLILPQKKQKDTSTQNNNGHQLSTSVYGKLSRLRHPNIKEERLEGRLELTDFCLNVVKVPERTAEQACKRASPTYGTLVIFVHPTFEPRDAPNASKNLKQDSFP